MLTLLSFQHVVQLHFKFPESPCGQQWLCGRMLESNGMSPSLSLVNPYKISSELAILEKAQQLGTPNCIISILQRNRTRVSVSRRTYEVSTQLWRLAVEKSAGQAHRLESQEELMMNRSGKVSCGENVSSSRDLSPFPLKALNSGGGGRATQHHGV